MRLLVACRLPYPPEFLCDPLGHASLLRYYYQAVNDHELVVQYWKGSSEAHRYDHHPADGRRADCQESLDRKRFLVVPFYGLI
jgi:hypothetical protein